MKKYVKKPIPIEAEQWFKNGDCKEDNCVEIEGKDGLFLTQAST